MVFLWSGSSYFIWDQSFLILFLNAKIVLTLFSCIGKLFQSFGPWKRTVFCLYLVRQYSTWIFDLCLVLCECINEFEWKLYISEPGDSVFVILYV